MTRERKRTRDLLIEFIDSMKRIEDKLDSFTEGLKAVNERIDQLELAYDPLQGGLRSPGDEAIMRLELETDEESSVESPRPIVTDSALRSSSEEEIVGAVHNLTARGK